MFDPTQAGAEAWEAYEHTDGRTTSDINNAALKLAFEGLAASVDTGERAASGDDCAQGAVAVCEQRHATVGHSSLHAVSLCGMRAVTAVGVRSVSVSSLASVSFLIHTLAPYPARRAPVSVRLPLPLHARARAHTHKHTHL